VTTLVLGAGGFLGLNLVDALQAAGEPLRCGRRKRSNVLGLRERRAPLVQADLESPEELRAAMAGCEIVQHLAGHYPKLSLDCAAALQTGLRQLENVLDAAAAAGVRRLIYVSSAATAAPSPAGGPSDESCVFAQAPGFGTYHDLKWAMEQRALAEQRLEVLVACPGACLGPWDLRVGTSALLVATARGLAPPHPDGVINAVDVRDVALALVRLARHPSPPRRLLLSGSNLQVQQMLEELSLRYGAPPPAAPLSAAEALALADAGEARAHAQGGRPELSREIADLIVHGVPLDASLARRTLGLAFRPLAETLDAADAWNRRMRILPSATTQVRP
jgi:dihydroflavonol-4-reductase